MLKKTSKKAEPQPQAEELRAEDKLLNVNASMQGVLSFKDPVNLCINGNFEGDLDTRGKLTIGRKAEVKANIKGEYVTISGKVNGEVVASRELAITSTARLMGNIRAPSLIVQKGALFEGNCEMVGEGEPETETRADILSAEEVARYLEVDLATVYEWAQKGEIPAFREGDSWRFEKDQIEEWLASERK